MPQPMQLSNIFDTVINAQAVSIPDFAHSPSDRTVIDALLGKPGHVDTASVSKQKAKPILADAKPSMQAAYSGEWSVDNARNDPSPRMFNIHHDADISKAKPG